MGHDLDDRLSLDFEQHVRFDQDSSRLAALMPELGITYRLTSWLRLGTGYRFAYRRDDAGDLGFRHRVHADAQVRLRRGPIKLSYRTRFQETLRGIDAADGARHVVRNRFAAGWKLNRTIEFVSAIELSHGLGRGNGVELRKRRITLGTEYAVGSYDLDFYYRYETPFNDNDEVPRHIAGIGVSTEL